ncbi:MAG: hypothetical protein HY297_01710 [Thaumarchaeota archaeon]|nr:hypothetical protein [Nitrososphaerota archaeon]
MSESTVEVEKVVGSKFKVVDMFRLEGGDVEFRVAYDGGTKDRFVELHGELLKLGFTPSLTGSATDCVLVVRKSQQAEAQKSRIPVILALLTLSSVIVFAIVERIVYADLAPSAPGYVVVLSYGATVVALLAARELGQRYFARRLGSSPPISLFLPGIPYLTSFLPTLGTLPLVRQASINKDRFFDARISGPLVCLAAAVVLYAVGDITSTQSGIGLEQSQFLVFNPSVIQWILDFALAPLVGGLPGLLRVSPIADGATVGFLVAFIGLIPLVSFDGGYLASLAWGKRAARIAGYLTIFLLFVIDISHSQSYFAISVLALLLAGRPAPVLVLDEVSDVSRRRRVFYLGAILLAAMSLPIPMDFASIPLG